MVRPTCGSVHHFNYLKPKISVFGFFLPAGLKNLELKEKMSLCIQTSERGEESSGDGLYPVAVDLK